MSAPAITAAPLPGKGIGLSRIATLSLRELRSGVRGFYVFIACVALGVAVITGVGALADALRAGFDRQGEAILGGDATFGRMHQRADDHERTWFASQGRVTESASFRAMARTVDGQEQALVEIKAVDGAYPLVGSVDLGGVSFDDAVRDGAVAAVDPVLLERLGLKVGDHMKIGEAEVTVRGAVRSEPDGIADRLTYGPRVFISLDTLAKTGFVKPGTLVRWRYALKLNDGAGDTSAGLVAFRERAKAALPDAGFTVADRRDPSPQVRRTLERLRQFLTLLGLTALLVGGVGVANAVATFIDRRRSVIATMKSLGATSRTVFAILLMQVMAMAGIGVAIGLALGLVLPGVLVSLYGDDLPIRAELSFSAASMLAGAAYGFLVALLFTLWPLGRAELVSPSVLFRDEVAPERVWPRRRVILLMAIVALALVGFTVGMAESKRIALYFAAGLALMFAVFWSVGGLVAWGARRLPRPRMPELRLAVGNLAAPGGLTRSVTLSLGTGLSLLVAVALANSSMVSELTSRMPTRSPTYFVLDISQEDYAGLVSKVESKVPGAHLVEAPMLRGRLVKLNGRDVEEIKAPPEAQWVLNGDRGLTYSDVLPEGSKLTQGEWWAKDYDGEPLVSFEQQLAGQLGLKIGDHVTVNVLGRNLTARIANLREVKWESLALNFVMVFSANALEAAPHNLLATIDLPPTTTLPVEVALAREIGNDYPTVTVIRVKDALDAFNAIFSKVMVAVRVAGAVTLAAGALVLAGALATAQRRRILEAVILKVIGATRRRILAAHFFEYAMLGAVAALFAVVLGSLAAWVAVRQVMDIEFTYTAGPVAEALLLALGLVLVFGGIGTWAVLRARPVPYLRSE